MSSSSEPRAGLALMATPELRSGEWTRFGDAGVLGDAVTEQVLGGLAESTRAAARAQGYATGWAEGRREAALEAAEHRAELERVVADSEARRRAEHDAALQSLSRTAALLQQQVAVASSELESHALELARELAVVLVGRELATSADPVADVVRRALAVLPALAGGLPVTVRLSPAVAAGPGLDALVEHGVRVQADAALGSHDAMVETTAEAIDLRVEAALERVREVLS